MQLIRLLLFFPRHEHYQGSLGVLAYLNLRDGAVGATRHIAIGTIGDSDLDALHSALALAEGMSLG